MAQSKLDLPDDLLSSKPSDHSWTSKVEASGGSDEEKVTRGSHEESKDHLALDNSIPLSPQWLYSKPNESKMDLRPGNSTDPSQKEGWRLDGSEDKKDWRRAAAENESSRRWREEERETGLLSARRDRRKADRRVDSVSVRETMDGRTLPSSDRWHDGANRTSGHEARRDSKWSSRWGPDDKEREPRTEKRIDVEKDKDDAHNDNQSSTISNRSASERDSDSRDKWRPRHRMEIHSSGSSSYRAAPGFGLERGRVEGSYSGFTVGRGRSNAIVRPTSFATQKSGSVIGKPTAGTFCYPRGKLLDIYRCRKLDPSFVSMPDEMEKVMPISQVDFLEPLAFVVPNADEQAILNDIWNGKIINSGVVHNLSGKGKPTENASGVGEYESIEGQKSILPPSVTEESAETSNDFGYGSNLSMSKEVDNGKDISAYGFAGKLLRSDETFDAKGMESSTSFDVKSKLPDDTSLLFVDDSTEQNMSELLGTGNEKKGLEKFVLPEEVYLYYIDPHGQTQGPFLGGDIMLWFEEGYFGTDLPVRLADAPEGTPFQTLGELMPHVKLKGVHPGSELEQSDASGGKLDPSLPVSSTGITDSSNVNDLSQPMSEINSDFKNFSAQRAQSRTSEPQGLMQQPNSESQSFHDFVAQDEEIVFPGRPSSSGYSTRRSAGSALDPSPNSNTQPPFLNEMRESGLSHQSDNKLHHFGMLWSELEGSHARYTEASDMPSSMGRTVPFAARTDPPSVVDNWSEAYRQDPQSVPNSFQDALSARHLSSVEAEPKNFDLAEQLMAGQFHNHLHQQQQLQHRNMLPPGHLNESLLERMSSQNLNQQLANPASDLEHLLALELQQQRHLQMQQHQLQQQQQFHQQQKLLQERQQSQARQVLLEQLLHGQMTDPGLAQSGINPIRAKNALDQVLLEQQFIRDLHRRPHLPSHFVSSMEQLTQAKFGQPAQQEQSRDLFELLSRAQHGQMQSLDHQILHQEQLRARQLSMGLRQQANMEEERYIDSIWPVNENDQFLRNIAGNHRAQSSGINPLDIYQRQQKPLHEDHLSHLERNLSFQDRLRQGLYEPGSVPFDRSLSLPAGAAGMNMDVGSALVHGHNLDMQELNARMQSAGQVGAFPSSLYPPNPNHPAVPNQFHVSHVNGIEGHWPEGNGQLANDWMESRFQQMHLNAERQKRDLEVKMPAQDRSLWMADEMNDDKSRRLLMELLHQKSTHQPVDPLHRKDGLPFDKRVQSGHYPGSGSVDHHFGVALDREPGLTNSFPVGSYGSNACETSEIYLACEQTNNVGNNENLPFRSEDSAMGEGHSYLSAISEPAQAVFADSSIIDKSSKNEYFDAEGRSHGSKSQSMTKGLVSEVQDCITGQTMLAAANHGDNPINILTRHSSLNVSSFYDDNAVPHDSFAEDKTTTQMPVLLKGQENILLRRPPVPHASTSQEGLSELVSDVRGKNSSSNADGGNPVNQGTDAMASSKKDARFRRTLSSGDADVSEPSFIDMLKSNGKKNSAADIHATAGGYSESSDGAQGVRSGKKKGKKGRQIDPALLGFKVTSNRIMMGEIQRIDD